jgi:transcriptional regulator of arginine metabolism
MKNERQKKIVELIQRYDIDTQEALVSRLAESGMTVTQTTVSRDIKELKLVKALTHDGAYKYVLPETKKVALDAVRSASLSESVIKVEAAKNIVVIKTYPGMANAVAVSVDTLEEPYVVGSVAGDDTILLVIRDDETAKEIERELKSTFGVR